MVAEFRAAAVDLARLRRIQHRAARYDNHFGAIVHERPSLAPAWAAWRVVRAETEAALCVANARLNLASSECERHEVEP